MRLETIRRLAALAAGVWTIALAGPAIAASPAADAAIEVTPGALVRWGGAGITKCFAGGESFPPFADGCWFPVDLLAKGEIPIAREVGGKKETRRLRVGDYPYAEQHVTIEDDSKVHPSKSDLVRIEAEQKRVGALWSLRGKRQFTLPLGSPLASLPGGGRFGVRRVFNGEPRSPHSGVDYSAKTGTPVFAVAAGRVALAEDQFFAGKAVYVDHGDGLVTMYFHLDKLAVKTGDTVQSGQTVGTSGATGRVSGPHLHFAARWRGARVDPDLLLRPAAAPVVP